MIFISYYLESLPKLSQNVPLYKVNSYRIFIIRYFKDFSNLMQVMIGRVDAAAATSITHQDVTAVLSWFKQVKVSTFAISNDFVQGI